MSIWNETSGANRGVMLLVAVVVVGVFVGTLSFGTSLLKKHSPQLSVAGPTTTDVQLPSAANSASPNTTSVVTPQVVTTTTLSLQQAQQQFPESATQNASQLSYRYNQANSGLTAGAYNQSTDVAKRFVLAEATGQGVENFQGYFSNLPADPWVKNYTFIYATTVATSDQTLVKALVWYKGTEKASGLPMTQVREGFFLKRSTSSSLDYAPIQLDAPSQDPDYGIQIIP